MEEFATRLKQLVSHFTKGNKQEFESICGLSNGYVQKTINRNSKPGEDMIRKILSGFPEINEEWIRHGTGAMLKEDPTNYVKTFKIKKIQSIREKISKGEDIAFEELSTAFIYLDELYIDAVGKLKDSKIAI